jgi:DMSO/TMAO reductase YedYZ molybdopterin-dependent catalytic subunit
MSDERAVYLSSPAVMRTSALLVLLLATMTACAAPPPTTTPIPSVPATLQPTPHTATSTPLPIEGGLTPCALPTIVAPTPPGEIPGYTQLDPTTGLHMTGRVQEIDLQRYRLEVTGKVDHPLSLTYDDLRCMPRIETRSTLVCPGFFEDVATWSGASLEYVLELAGVQAGATGIQLTSADGYSTSVPVETAHSGDSFLAYEWEGQPLPILHGFPVRAVFPNLDGNKWVKWLVKIEVY